MKVNKEFIFNEEDIKEAIKDCLSYKVENKDKVSVVLNAKPKTDGKDIAGFEIIAICKEDTGNA